MNAFIWKFATWYKVNYFSKKVLLKLNSQKNFLVSIKLAS